MNIQKEPIQGDLINHQEQSADVTVNNNLEASSMISAIAAAASNPDVDVDKMEKLMDMHERILNRSAKESYSRDYVEMKPNLPMVLKTHDNTQTSSKYAKLEDINKVIDPILSKYGFGTQTKVTAQTEAGITLEATLLHKGGHSESNIVFIPMDDKGIKGTINKTGPHAVSSSITYAKRIALCALLNISTGDDVDCNIKEDIGFITLEQAVEIDELIKEVGANKEKFLAYVDALSVQEIPARNYAKAINMLKAKKSDDQEKQKNGAAK